MKRILLLFCAFLFIISCATKYTQRSIDSIALQEFKVPNVSIRAIMGIDNNTAFYAGSNGIVGFKTAQGISLNTLHIKYKDSLVPNFRSLAFNGKDYFALSIGNPALLYKISNGKAAIVYQEIHTKVFYDAMTFFDDNIHGIAVGDPTENCASIILTSDGGNTWQKLPCKKLPEFEEGEAFFAASNTNIKTLGSTVWIASGGKKARVLKSDDYGKTWQVFDTPIIQGNGSQGIYSIDFADKNKGITIGGDYSKPEQNKNNKAITQNGGKTWTLVANLKKPNYKSCVKYVPDTKGKEVFAVGKTGISFSNDGGNTWKEVSKEGYYAINFVNRNTAWLSGYEKIAKLTL
jgi:photosystem II stability/assembly factor-like uncharacterized protein